MLPGSSASRRRSGHAVLDRPPDKVSVGGAREAAGLHHVTANVLASIYRLAVILALLKLLREPFEGATEVALIVEDGDDGVASFPPRGVVCIATHHEATNPVVVVVDRCHRVRLSHSRPSCLEG